MSEKDALDWVLSWHDKWDREAAASWAVTDGDVLVGRVGIQAIDLSEGIAELAYWVIPDARGRGVATSASRAVLGWAFSQVGLHRVELTHATDNEVSCRIAEKLGFTFEGVMRQQALHLDGWHDMHLHSLLDSDGLQPPL